MPASLLAALAGTAAPASTVYVHQLRVVANPSLSLTDQDVDRWIAAANTILARKTADLPWDIGCSGVRLARKGPVKAEADVPPTGTMADLRRAVMNYSPGYNLVIASGVDCGGGSATVGCSQSGEPFVAVSGSGMQGLIITHERGHSLGLAHSEDSPVSEAAAGPAGRLIMFWQLAANHTGKNATECAAFASAMLSSIDVQTRLASLGAISAHSGEMAAMAIAEPPQTPAVSSDADLEAPPAVEDEVPERGPLTSAAYDLIVTPWEQVPVARIMALSELDKDSIRRLLAGSPSPLWSQALTALALVGGPADADFVRAPLSYHEPEGPADAAARDLHRAVLRARLAVPFALGLLARSTGSEKPVSALDTLKSISQSTEAVGADAALSFRMETLKGLAVANTPNAKVSLKAALESAKAPTSLSALATKSAFGRMVAETTTWSLVAPFAEPQVSTVDRERLDELQQTYATKKLEDALAPR